MSCLSTHSQVAQLQDQLQTARASHTASEQTAEDLHKQLEASRTATSQQMQQLQQQLESSQAREAALQLELVQLGTSYQALEQQLLATEQGLQQRMEEEEALPSTTRKLQVWQGFK
jgi:chromosome segregation ATPase